MNFRLIDGTGITKKLDIPSKNKEQTALFMNAGTRDFNLESYTLPYAYQIRKSIEGDEYRLIAGSNMTAYFLKLKESAHTLPGTKNITQVIFWRSDLPEHEAALTGLSKLIFSFLLKHFTVVISDEELRPDRAAFWRARIRQAIANPNQFAYVLDTAKVDAEPVALMDQESLSLEWEKIIWGWDREVRADKFFIISGKPLAHTDYWISR